MCEFCTKHGEGKKWYLNASNYANELLQDARRRSFVTHHFDWLHDTYKDYFPLLRRLPLKLPFLRTAVARLLKRIYLYKHWGQVLPIEDVEEILGFVKTITRIPCGCRMVTRGKELRSCFLISLDPAKTALADIVDQSYFGGPDVARFETVTREEALTFMRESESKGMLHTVWAFAAPFVGGFCNCDASSGCMPLTLLKDTALPVIFRAEYIARLDADLCTGCRSCEKICPFGALRWIAATSKSVVDERLCYGCGICRSVCPKGAIMLVERHTSPVAAKVW